MPISGLLAGSSLGWESVFYFFGATSILWCLVWAALVYNYPDQHPRITQRERILIETKKHEYQVAMGGHPSHVSFTAFVGCGPQFQRRRVDQELHLA